MKSAPKIICAVCWFFIVLLCSVCAEQLPIKVYTAADGLPRDRVAKVVADPWGFLWFCTNDGISRFDGYEFTNYSTANGLPHRLVNDLLITKSGDYWVATDYGVARFNPLATTPNTKFQAYAPDSIRPGGEAVDALYEDTNGTIWAGTGNGLHRLRESSGNYSLEYVPLGEKSEDRLEVNDIVEDSPGVLLIGTGFGLYRHFKDGATERFTTAQGLPQNQVRVVFKIAMAQSGLALALVWSISKLTSVRTSPLSRSCTRQRTDCFTTRSTQLFVRGATGFG